MVSDPMLRNILKMPDRGRQDHDLAACCDIPSADENSANHAQANRLQNGLMLVRTSQFVGGVVDVEGSSALRNPEDIAHFPGGLAIHRPP